MRVCFIGYVLQGVPGPDTYPSTVKITTLGTRVPQGTYATKHTVTALRKEFGDQRCKGVFSTVCVPEGGTPAPTRIR